MFVMPDPSLPPEKQMEQLTGGKLVEPGSTTGGVAGIASPKGLMSAASSPSMMRDFSVVSMSNRTTASTKFRSDLFGGRAMSLIMSPSIKFGMYR